MFLDVPMMFYKFGEKQQQDIRQIDKRVIRA